ncbi:mucin-2, partial [Uranotaenia lowii]|uniref:mucin-2 n=1 Tax=Uranotaenia lowii TaxID=190385 RepID=UPI002478793A
NSKYFLFADIRTPAIFSALGPTGASVPAELQDPDSFSEIDLHSNAESLNSASQPAPVEYNPLLDLEDTESRSSEQNSSYLQQTSNITAQFAAQLPNVASTVFSTFSRVIRGTSPGVQQSSNPGGVQPASTSVSPPEYPQPQSQNFYPQPYSLGAVQPEELTQQPLPPPPTFFNPQTVGSAQQNPGTAPPTAEGINSYRLGGNKKKAYAHIPGLSSAGPPSLVVAPALNNNNNNQDLGAFPPVSEPLHVASAQQNSTPKIGFSFFEKIPSLLEKIPKPVFTNNSEQQSKPPEVVPHPTDYFNQQSATIPAPTDCFNRLLEPETSLPPPQESFVREAPLQPESSLPPPQFFTPAQIPNVAHLPQTQPPKNPYSSNRISRGVGLYKNRTTSTGNSTIPTYLPNQEPPKAVPPAFPSVGSAVNPGESVQHQPISVFNPTPIQLQSVQNQAILTPQSTSDRPSTTDTAITNSRPPSSLSESLSRKVNPFASFEQSVGSSQQETKTILESRSKSSENVLSPPPRPNSNLSEPALFSEATTRTIPLSIFNPEPTVPLSEPLPLRQESVNFFNPANFATNQPPERPYVANNVQETNLLTQTVLPSTVVFDKPDQFPQEATSFSDQEFIGNKQYPTDSLASQTTSQPAVPVNFFNPVNPVIQTKPQSSVNFFNPAQILQQPTTVAPPLNIPPSGISKTYNLQKTRRSAYTVPPSLATTQPSSTLNTLPQTAPLTEPNLIPAQQTFFNPISQQQQPHPHPSSNNPLTLYNPSTISTHQPAAPASQDINANLSSVFQQSTTPILYSSTSQQDINYNSLPSVTNFFSDTVPQQKSEIRNDLNANFCNLQLSDISSTAPRTTIDASSFFNSGVPSSVKPNQQPPSATTGQTISQVPIFNFFGQPTPADRATEETDTIGSVEKLQTDDDLGIQVIEPDHRDQQELEEQGQDSDEQETNRREQNNLNDSQLVDDRDDDPVGRVRIGNAPEPIFSSDNLFEFKKSLLEDDTYSKDVLIDANSSSMAAMTATAAAATGGTTVVDSSMTSINETTNIAYRPVYQHWFFRREVETKILWTPFTMSDSLALEDALPLLASPDQPDQPRSSVIVHVDGGRHDVNIEERKMYPVYWKGASQDVRRCSWFYKNVDSRYVPYEEDVADLLEREYKEAATSGEWQRRIVIPNGETVVFHGPSVIVHFLQTQNPESWGGSSPVPQTTNRPRVVKRGVDEFNIEDGEPEQIDHLLFMVHGIGEACDLRFRPVEEVVDEFRSISAQLVQSHYRSSFDRGDIGRVEVLPISWHNDLHSEESGIDKKLKAITLKSIPKLRNFTNDTVLDVLFYTSPVFCQSIIDAVGNSLNRLYSLFCQRNPNFRGRVSLAGHSLGSLILFDLLCHQKPEKPMEAENSENPDGDKLSALMNVHHRPLSRKCSQQINYEVGPAGTGQPYITYPQLQFQPAKFFALGSPIGMFVTVRGIDALGLDFKLPTCDSFFNIFHPYDPVAYRIEALVNAELSNLRPVLIPHHKGRKRMHLELKETMMRVGMDLKQRVLDTFRNTMEAVYSITSLNKPDRNAIEQEVDKVIEDQLKFETGSTSSVTSGDLDGCETDLPLGRLNQSRRIDYVLQEAPLEFINEYVFALTSHVCYWESEDTMLFLMKEIYSSMGVQSDSQIPQQSMTIERPVTSPTPSTSSQSQFSLFPQRQPTGCNR